jgi:hypothetical protein
VLAGTTIQDLADDIVLGGAAQRGRIIHRGDDLFYRVDLVHGFELPTPALHDCFTVLLRAIRGGEAARDGTDGDTIGCLAVRSPGVHCELPVECF